MIDGFISKSWRSSNPREGVIAKAYFYALKAHTEAGNIRKSGEEYITHPVAVSSMLKEYGADNATLAAALLHDVVEKTDRTLYEIKREFGNEITFLVDGVTRAKTAFKNFRKIEKFASKDRRVLLIKLADRIHNYQCHGPNNCYIKKNHYATKEFLIPLAKSYGFRDIAIRLEEIVEEVEKCQ
ncbi:MAG: HD domain-containing protein [archaeon]